MSNIIDIPIIERAAAKDARAGIEASDDQIQKMLGPPPSWDPVGNAEHAAVAENFSDRSALEETQADERRAEEEIIRHDSPFWLQVLLVVAVATEAFGAIRVMANPGRENPERTIVGIALAMAMLGLTAAVARGGNSSPPAGAVPRRSRGSTALLFVYVIFALAIATVRVEPPEEDGSDVATLAEGVILAVTTVLPAFVTEWVFRKRQPARFATRELKVIRRRRRELESRRAKAQKFVRDLARKRERYAQDEARLRAAYALAHSRATALLDAPKPADPGGEEEQP